MSVLMRAIQSLREKYAKQQKTETQQKIKPIEGELVMANELVTVNETLTAQGAKKKRQHNFSAVFKRNKTLCDMMMYRRPSKKTDDPTYRQFLETYVEPLFGAPDEFGNYMLIIPTHGDEVTEDTMPRICYTAHHDTVHTKTGMQRGMVMYNTEPLQEKGFGNMNTPTLDKDTYLWISNPPPILETKEVIGREWNKDAKAMVEVTKTVTTTVQSANASNCLGADCTTGVWLIREMVLAKCPGVYMIFADEEVGGVGSRAIANEYTSTKAQVEALSKIKIKRLQTYADGWAGISFDEKREVLPYAFWIDHVDIVMSFDRKNIDSIITRQSGGVCASKQFVDDLSAILSPQLMKQGYRRLIGDPGGTFTDSASFMKLVPECTNLSVGYMHQHGERECQNYSFALALRDALVKNAHKLNDPDILGSYRDPNAKEVYGTGNYGTAGYNASAYGRSSYWDTTDDDWDRAGVSSTSSNSPVSQAVKKPVDLYPPVKSPNQKTEKEKALENDLAIDYHDFWKTHLDDEEDEEVIAKELQISMEDAYSDAIKAYEDGMNINLTMLGELIDMAEIDIDAFVIHAMENGVTLQSMSNAISARENEIQAYFKQALIDNNIVATDKQIAEFMKDWGDEY